MGPSSSYSMSLENKLSDIGEDALDYPDGPIASIRVQEEAQILLDQMLSTPDLFEYRDECLTHLQALTHSILFRVPPPVPKLAQHEACAAEGEEDDLGLLPSPTTENHLSSPLYPSKPGRPRNARDGIEHLFTSQMRARGAVGPPPHNYLHHQHREHPLNIAARSLHHHHTEEEEEEEKEERRMLAEGLTPIDGSVKEARKRLKLYQRLRERTKRLVSQLAASSPAAGHHHQHHHHKHHQHHNSPNRPQQQQQQQKTPNTAGIASIATFLQPPVTHLRPPGALIAQPSSNSSSNVAVRTTMVPSLPTSGSGKFSTKGDGGEISSSSPPPPLTWSDQDEGGKDVVVESEGRGGHRSRSSSRSSLHSLDLSNCPVSLLEDILSQGPLKMGASSTAATAAGGVALSSSFSSSIPLASYFPVPP